MIKQKQGGQIKLAVTLTVLFALLLGLGIQLALGYSRYHRSRETAARLLETMQLLASQQAQQRRAEYPAPGDAAADTASERLGRIAAEKGAFQRGKHLELLMLVNPWNTLPEGYVPELAEATSNWQPHSEYVVDARCAASLQKMLNDCLLAGGIPEICSAYRTLEEQQWLFDNKIERLIEEGVEPEEAPALAATTVALPGTSEHQLGLAVDILDINYPYLDQWQEYTWGQQWLMEHCWEYGFILRYPNGTSDITGIIYEPWHYRYVGLTHARNIHELGVTLEEYIALRNGR